MGKYNKETLKAEKTRINQLLDQENRTCAKCHDKDAMGCDGCYHDRRKKHLLHQKEKVAEALANHQSQAG